MKSPKSLQSFLETLTDIEHGEGTITVRAAIEGSELVVEVEDEGASISAADADRLFDRFYKADPARPGGSGLGLSIARENARLLGGDITLSPSTSGTRFTARLPVSGDDNGQLLADGGV